MNQVSNGSSTQPGYTIQVSTAEEPFELFGKIVHAMPKELGYYDIVKPQQIRDCSGQQALSFTEDYFSQDLHKHGLMTETEAKTAMMFVFDMADKRHRKCTVTLVKFKLTTTHAIERSEDCGKGNTDE